MKKALQKITVVLHPQNPQGFVLPFTMLITVLILFLTVSSMTLLSKQVYFSRLSKESQVAYYAADDAIACATSLDDSYLGADGIGIFPYSSTTNLGIFHSGSPSYVSYKYIDTVLASTSERLTAASLAIGGGVITVATSGPNAVMCSQSPIFDTDPASVSAFATSSTDFVYHFINPATHVPEVEYGQTSTYKMKMALGDGTFRCAKVTVHKTPSYRQIIAQGYSSCNINITSVERAVVNTTVAEGLNPADNITSAYDFFVQDVCLDASAHVIDNKSPLDVSCISTRNLLQGEVLPYHKHDQNGGDSSAPYGWLRSDSYPSPTSDKYIVQTFDFGATSGHYFGVNDTSSDGFNIFETRGLYSSLLSNKNTTGSTFYFIAPKCSIGSLISVDDYDSWVLSPSYVTDGGNANMVTQLSAQSSDASCPGSFDSSYTEWSVVPSVTYKSGQSLRTLQSKHFSNSTTASSDNFVEMYFTRELGATRWEKWERTYVDAGVSHGHNEISVAASLDASNVCNNTPGYQLLAGHTWYRVDCREWTNIRPKDNASSDSPSFWPIPSIF